MGYSQLDIQKIIENFEENNSKLVDLQLHGFCVWPCVKSLLWGYLSKQLVSSEPYQRQSSVIHERKWRRVYAYFLLGARLTPKFFLQITRIIPSLFGLAQPVSLAVLFNPRPVKISDSICTDFYIGSFLKENSQNNLLIVGDERSVKNELYGMHQVISQDFLRAISGFLIFSSSFGLFSNKLLKTEIEHIVSQLSAPLFSLCGFPKSLIRLSILYFSATFIIYRFFFRLMRPKRLVVVDFDSKFGEIAAAKSCQIEVLDIQHGTFWTGDLDHSWKEHWAMHKEKLPFPNSMLLYGQFWKDIALENCFWNEGDLFIMGSPIMSQLKKNSKDNFSLFGKKRLNLLLLSGDLGSQPAADFLQELLEINDELFNITVKLHPRESFQSSYYREIDERSLKKMKFVQTEESVYDLIQQSDLVVGFASTALIEAVMLGVPTFSISGIGIVDGISGAHNDNHTLEKLIKFAGDADNFYSQIMALSQNEAEMSDWYELISEKQDYMFSMSFDKSFQSFLSDRK